jgi:hypothetical protein
MLMRAVFGAMMMAAAVGLDMQTALAVPKKVIILRHGEKENATTLCGVGIQRSMSLMYEFLGNGAKKSLFKPDDPPAAFFAITLHSLELASPAASSWNLPVITYSVVPLLPKMDQTLELDARTDQAAQDVLNNSAWNGKTVVMVWEHKHIADKALTMTLRNLLNLDKLTGKDHVHETWQGSNYDYFWIVEYPPNSTTPKSFQMVRQDFSFPYGGIPTNGWGDPENLPKDSGCE